MGSRIHPSAVIDPSAEIADGVEIGPHVVVGGEVSIGDGTVVLAGSVLAGPTVIGRENRIGPLASLGADPQDLKFHGEETRLRIGDRNVFREFATVHRGTSKGGGETVVGSGGLYMTGAHIAHDCIVGDRVIFANSGTLAGHVVFGDDATLGAFSAVHQFCRVGPHAYIGGYSVLTRDVLPFVKTVGGRQGVSTYGVNRIGLERKGFTAEEIAELESAYRVLRRERSNLASTLDSLAGRPWKHPHVPLLLDFLRSSERGAYR